MRKDTKAGRAGGGRPGRRRDDRPDRRDAAPKRRTYHHGDLRRALIEASLVLLREHGPHGLTLREAARRAGVSQAAPYRHFASKDALLAAIAEEGFLALRDVTAAAAVPHGDQPLKRLVEMSIVYVRFAVENAGHYRVMFGPVVLDKSAYPSLGAVTTASFEALVGAIADCQRAGALRQGDPRLAAMALWTLGHGLAELALDRQIPPAVLASIPLERLAEVLVQLLLHGLVA